MSGPILELVYTCRTCGQQTKWECRVADQPPKTIGPCGRCDGGDLDLHVVKIAPYSQAALNLARS
jgi:transcription elongation factor Elf1